MSPDGSSLPLFDRMQRRFLHAVYIDLHGPPSSTILLLGSPRSGTTWLANVINVANDYRFIFEPFRPETLPITRRLPVRLYLPPGYRDDAVAAVAQRILTGRVRARSSDRFNRKRLVTRRLIKDVWANLLGPWLADAFPGVKIVFLVRHPCAVIRSQLLRRDWQWFVDVRQLLSQNLLLDDFLRPVSERLAEANGALDQHAWTWAIENVVALSLLPGDWTHVLTYEGLVSEPEEEIHSLFSFLGRKFDPDMLARALKLSQVSTNKTTAGSSPHLGRELSKDLSRRDEESILRIASMFGLDELYGRDAVPKASVGSVRGELAVRHALRK